MTQDEFVIKRFCTEYHIELKKIDSYGWNQSGYVINSEGRIEVLNLFSLGIEKIPEYIANLSELKILQLAGNQLSSIKEISGLTKLEILIILYNNIVDISVVKEFKVLREFLADGNPIVDITPIKHLENLEKISLDCGRIKDLIPLCYCQKLNSLILDNIKQSTNLVFLRDCKNIKHLVISEVYETHKKENIIIEIFENIQHLDLLSLRVYCISQLDTEKFKLFPELKLLNIGFTNVKDISFLSHLTKLEELSLCNVDYIDNIQTISELTKLKKLKKLRLSKCNIRNIRFRTQ